MMMLFYRYSKRHRCIARMIRAGHHRTIKAPPAYRSNDAIDTIYAIALAFSTVAMPVISFLLP